MTTMGPHLLNGKVVMTIGVNAEVTPEIANRLPNEMGGFPVVVVRTGPFSLRNRRGANRALNRTDLITERLA